MKVHLRLDNSEDADPASRFPFGEMLSAAGGVFAAALEEFAAPGLFPEKVEISVSFLSLRDMKEQNLLYRGVAEPTDVLSFPLWEENGDFSPEKGLPVLPLGDILICTDYVRNDAPSEEAFKAELALMFAHGFLHLLAWDHDTDERRCIMESAQEKIRTMLLSVSEISSEKDEGGVAEE